eukprot:307168-Chlamydomonas_euryale.AAC.1
MRVRDALNEWSCCWFVGVSVGTIGKGRGDQADAGAHACSTWHRLGARLLNWLDGCLFNGVGWLD